MMTSFNFFSSDYDFDSFKVQRILGAVVGCVFLADHIIFVINEPANNKLIIRRYYEGTTDQNTKT